MELLKYLNEWFYVKQELLNLSKTEESQLNFYQAKQVMPQPSYRVKMTVACESFFGPYANDENLEFYAKGYASWLGILAALNPLETASEIFASRYKKQVSLLMSQGIECSDTKLNSDIDAHILKEWQAFLKGTYGVCTKSGLPEDIACKELAIAVINEITASVTKSELTVDESERLKRAIDLLDEASSPFAPHERLKSSRHRLIDEVRRIYRL